ncbi:helix-turn-helix domain-containing protein [Streptomyces justiciae]|uniref:helix-turn-helix domain-containing protein n=1 Tax=Streptomyces justiciae TaxID=2780140 RepID=UPI0036F412D6
MQLRYSFRLYPDTGQQTALAKALGCARVVFHDAVRAREDARKSRSALPQRRRAVEEVDHRGEADGGTVLAG